MKANIIKIFASLIISLLILFLYLSPFIPLTLRGYKLTNITNYKSLSFTNSEHTLSRRGRIKSISVLQVFTLKGEVNLIKIAKHKWGYWLIVNEGNPTTNNKPYTSIDWYEYCSEGNENTININSDFHRLFLFKKSKEELEYRYEDLPQDINYLTSEKNDLYFIELISTTDTSIPELSTLNINQFIDITN